MLIHRIITGYVAQTFDTKAQKWVGQEFVADKVPFVTGQTPPPVFHLDANGRYIAKNEFSLIDRETGLEANLAPEMQQPKI